MLAVQNWAKDKHPFIALVAPQMAAFSRELPEILRNHKKHQLANSSVTLPRLTSWYALYRNHRRYCEPYLKMLLEASEFAGQLATLGISIHEWSQEKDDLTKVSITEDDLLNGRLFWHNLKAMSFTDLRSDFEDRRLDYQTTATVERYMQQYKMELSFIFLVFVPCYMLYQTTPTKLYRKAPSQNIIDTKAIDMLLRLDPLMLHDPAVGQQIQHIRLFGRESTYQNLVEAPLKPIKAKVTKNKIKTSIAAMISLIAEALNQPLTAADIKGLFDAIAKDADKQSEDSAIPRNTASLGKTIQRKRQDWQQLIKPDSKT